MEDDKAVESAKAADNVDNAESVKRPHEDSCDGGDDIADKHKEVGRETRSPEEKKHKANDGTAAVSDTVPTGGTDKVAEEDGGEYRPQYLGVTYRSRRCKYQARMYRGSREYNLGLFDLASDAALAYDAAYRIAGGKVSREDSEEDEGAKTDLFTDIEQIKFALDWLDVADENTVQDGDSSNINFKEPMQFRIARNQEIEDNTSGKIDYPNFSSINIVKEEELKVRIKKEILTLAKAYLALRVQNEEGGNGASGGEEPKSSISSSDVNRELGSQGHSLVPIPKVKLDTKRDVLASRLESIMTGNSTTAALPNNSQATQQLLSGGALNLQSAIGTNPQIAQILSAASQNPELLNDNFVRQVVQEQQREAAIRAQIQASLLASQGGQFGGLGALGQLQLPGMAAVGGVSNIPGQGFAQMNDQSMGDSTGKEAKKSALAEKLSVLMGGDGGTAPTEDAAVQANVKSAASLNVNQSGNLQALLQGSQPHFNPMVQQTFLQNLMSQQGQQQQLQQQLNAAANPNLAMLMAANAGFQQQQQQMNNQTLAVNQFAGLQQAYPMQQQLQGQSAQQGNTQQDMLQALNANGLDPASVTPEQLQQLISLAQQQANV